jgi:dipeptidyl aminopeptidase/acylaminoacyl peptidase
MAAWAVTQTNRFKAAVIGAPVTDLITMQRTSGRSENFNLFFGGSPVNRKDVYEACSPVTFVNRAQTPSLILHGEEDGVVPITQSYEFYQALKDLNVTVEFVIYPREGHGIGEKMHQIDLQYRVLNWFDTYLKNGKN